MGHIGGPLGRPCHLGIKVVGHLARQPVVGAPAWINPLHELIGVPPHRLAAPAQLANLLGWQGRHIEVEQHGLGPALPQHLLGHIEGDGRRRLKVTPLEVGTADRQGRQALDRALHGRTHGA